ncbi:MAG: acyltransferase family protein [Oscillospiraceae bacterium]|jgi:fucose 4-O-acetylase-like acetyltransferase|nr:acyltransferase family protein [Oscillospiraceae bacterium]
MPTATLVPPPAKERLWFWDNTKALLILLVVIGHALEMIRGGGQTVRSMTNLIYFFHMPLFILISGYFSKRLLAEHASGGTQALPARRAVGFIALFFGLVAVNTLIRSAATGALHPATPRLLVQSGAPWYLLASVWWIAFTYALGTLRMKPWLWLTIAVLCGLAVGYDQSVNDFLALLRAVNYYPFFLLGVLFPKKAADFLRRPWVRALAAAVLVVALALALWRMNDGFGALFPLFTGRHPYRNIPGAAPFRLAGLYRLGHYVLSSLVGLAIVSVMPDRRIPFVSVLGSRTLQVYLWQSVLFSALYSFGVQAVPAQVLPLPVYLLFAAALAFFLSLKPLGVPVAWLQNLRLPRWARVPSQSNS